MNIIQRIFVSAALLFSTTVGAQCPIVEITPDTATPGSVTQAYSVGFAVTAPGTWTFAGSNVPPGTTMASNGTLSGVPSSAGSFLSRIVATDTQGCVATRELALEINASACLDLTVGQVVLTSGASAESFCVASGASDREFTFIPVNTATSATSALALTGTGIQAVTGPPTPRPEASPLAPLAFTPASGGHGGHGQNDDLPAIGTPAQRAAALIAGSPQPTGTVGLTVGQILDIQVAAGCSGALDMRKGRVEAISPVAVPAEPRLYMVQEVIDDPGNPGTWIPSVPGGFTQGDFQVFQDAYDTPAGGVTAPGSGILGTLAHTGARDTYQSYFGDPTDVDANGGTIVFFTRAMNELSPPASSSIVLGAFESRDLFSAATCPRSNEGEIVYLMVPDPTGVVNSNVRTVSFVWGSTVRSLAHFSTHLVNAARRIYVNSASGPEEDWLDEGLAWIAEEQLFFNTSVGLAPQQNIQLSTLTTGPNASRRVAAFNTYMNQQFGVIRGIYLQNPTTLSLGGLRIGPLRVTPQPSATMNPHALLQAQYAITATFLRYASDRLNTGDAAFFNALSNSTSAGIANLQAVIGTDPDPWARDFAIAFYGDDAVVGVTPEYTLPSWNYRSVYGGLGGFPLAVHPLADATAMNFSLAPGGNPRWVRFGIPGGAPAANFTFTSNPVAPLPADVLTAIMRTK